MDDLISRAAAIDALKRAAYWQDAERKIAELPAVDAAPVEWLREKANGNDFVIGRAARFVLRAWEQETQKLGIDPKEG